jgi:hypothetical protein
VAVYFAGGADVKNLMVLLTTLAFLAFSGWDVWEATGNLLGLPGFYVALGIEQHTPWFLLYAGLGVPVIAVVVGLWWARGRGVMARTLVYVIVLAASNAVAMSLLAAGQAWLAYVLPQLAS